jgi:hypothetical protein
MDWKDLIEDTSWLEEDSWVEKAGEIHGHWEPWKGESEESSLKVFLEDREAQIETEREAETKQVQNVREARDSLLRQLSLAQDAQQLGWVTQRFHKLISQGENVADKMLHLRSGMLETLDRAQVMYSTALDVERARIQSGEVEVNSERQHQEDTRKTRREADDYIRKLRDDTQKKLRESRDANFRVAIDTIRGYSTCSRCGSTKPLAHRYCCCCH